MSDKDDFEAEYLDGNSDSAREIEPASGLATNAGASGSRVSRAIPSVAKRPSPSGWRVAGFVVPALLVGGASGWFGHIQQAKAASLKEDASLASMDSDGTVTGPCGAWQDKICSSVGEQSAACRQAKGATELLTASTCEAGLAAMPVTLSRLRSARASCEKLVSKLCADLSPGSPMCTAVKERTVSFPEQRCDEMRLHYDGVLSQLKLVEAQGGSLTESPVGIAHQ